MTRPAALEPSVPDLSVPRRPFNGCRGQKPTRGGIGLHRFRWPTGVAALMLVVAFGIVTTAASSKSDATKAITPSPPWTASQLSAPAGDNWLEYYGSLNGNRYSSLNQITTSNVSSLKQVWQISL